MRCLFYALFLSVVLSACLLKADGFADGAPTPDGGATSDGGATGEAGTSSGGPKEAGTVDGGDGLPAHGPNLLLNGDFELGCTGFSGNGFDSKATSLARNGTGGCQICATQDDDTHLFANVTGTKAKNGDKLYAEIWYRVPDPNDATAKPATNKPVFKMGLNNGNTSADSNDSDGAIPTTTWTRVNAVTTSDLDDGSINLELHLDANGGKCIVLDDAAVYIFK